MDRATEDTTGVDHRGLRWSAVFRLLGWLAPVLAILAMIFLRGEFSTHKEVETAVAPFQTAPARLQSLEDYRLDQKQSQRDIVTALGLVQQELSGIKVLQAEQSKTADRILRRLDQSRCATELHQN